MSTFQGQGRQAYTRKEYTKALELFTRALYRAETAQLHGDVSACHERLGDLQAALHSAKKAIQLCKADPTGYLRAGKVLVKMEKRSVALEVYGYGLRRVRAEGEGRRALRKVHDELFSQLAPPKSVDPFTMLPIEVVEMILDYLDFRQRINCCRVSIKWTSLIRSLPNLWSTLDFTGARKMVKNAFVSRAINVGRTRIKRAALWRMQDTDKAIAALIRHCGLEELELHDAGCQGDNLLPDMDSATSLKVLRLEGRSQLELHTLPRILQHLESFQCSLSAISSGTLDWRPMDRLRELALTPYSSSFLKHLLAQTPNLRSLEFHLQPIQLYSVPDFRVLSKLERLNISGQITEPGSILLPESIRYLTIQLENSPPRRTLPYTSAAPIWKLPLLEELTFSAVGHMAVELLQMFGFGPNPVSTTAQFDSQQEPVATGCLKRLSLPFSRAFHKDSGFASVCADPRLSGLEHFAVFGALDFTDVALQLVADTFPELKSIDLCLTVISGVGLKQLVQKLAKRSLRHVTVNDCREIGPDAVDWARGQGVKVEFKMTEAGKKIGHYLDRI